MTTSKVYTLKTILVLAMMGIALTGCSTGEDAPADNQDVLSDIQEASDTAEASTDDAETPETFDSEDEFGSEDTAEAPNESAPEESAAEGDSLSELEAEDDSLEGALEQEDPTTAETPSEETPSVDSGETVRITAIGFTPNAAGGSVIIKTNGPAKHTKRFNAETNQYVVEIQNATLNDGLTRPFIMKDFDSDFGSINAYQNDGGNVARIVIQMKEPGEPVIQAEGNQFVILPARMAGVEGVVADATAAAAGSDKPSEEWKKSYDVKLAEKEESSLGDRSLDEFLSGNMKFFGRPISIQVSDAPIQEVINFIAEESGMNIVLGDDVKGNVSIKLRQVPWDQALVIVMRARGLGYVRQGNVMRITRLETLQAEANSAKAIVDAQATLSPVRVKVIPVSYANVTELTGQLTPFLSAGRGRAVPDQRTSAIIVTDTSEVLTRVERLVRELDLPPTQVMIEGKIVEAAETFSRTLGVNWNYSGVPTEISGSGGYQGSPINLATRYGSSGLSQSTLTGANSSLGISVGAIDFFGNLSATLGLAQNESLAKVISSPRIVTMNRAPAEISQAGEVISVNSTVDQNSNRITTAVRNPVLLKLAVTPQITSEGSVILDVDVTRQFPGAIAESSTLSRPVNTRAAKTKVLVPNGQTAVIGGIYQNDETESEQGTPWLKDIPFLGWLFKGKQIDRTKNELLIFLTPRILNPEEQSVGEGS